MTLPVSVPTVPEWQLCRVRWAISDYAGTPVSATIALTSSVDRVIALASRKTLVRQFPTVSMTDGVLRDTSGNPWVDLVATLDPDISPNGWTITATATLVSGQKVAVTFTTPVNGDIDLTTQLAVPDSTGTPIVRGRGVTTITAVNTTATITYTDGTTSTFTLPAGPAALFDADAAPYLNATPPAPTGPGVQPTSKRLVTEASAIYAPTTGPIRADLSAFGVFLPEAHGARGDGVVDDTAAVNAAIAAAQASGGKVWLQSKTYLCLGAITPVYTGPSTAPVQKPVRITSNGGAGSNGYWAVGPTNGGPILDLRYNGVDGLHPAKIDTRGAGSLEIDHITLQSGGTDDFPFLRASNTTCFLHHNMVVGNAAKIRANSVQDVFVFGGTSSATVGDGPDAPFQGYGGKVHDNYFANIRRGFLGQNYCNSISVENNTFSTTCGSSTGGAIEFHGSAVAGFVVGNLTRGNTIEVTNYRYAIVADYAANCTFGPDGYWDPTPATFTGSVFIMSTSNWNRVVAGYYPDAYPFVIDPGRSTEVDNFHQAMPSFFNTQKFFRGYSYTSNPYGIGIQALAGKGSAAVVNATDGNFPYPEPQLASVPPTQVTDAVLNGTTTLTSATAAFTLQEVGMPIAGTGIPAGTQILSRQNATTVTLDNAATSGTVAVPVTGVAVTFTRFGTGGTAEVGFSGRHIISKGAAPSPSISPGPAAGVGSTVTVSGTDTAYTLTLTTGTGTTGGRQCAIGAAINWAAAPRVVMTARNAAAAAAMSNVWMETGTANNFINAVGPLAVSTVHVWDVVAIA